jgi:hypothetical protein
MSTTNTGNRVTKELVEFVNQNSGLEPLTIEQIRTIVKYNRLYERAELKRQVRNTACEFEGCPLRSYGYVNGIPHCGEAAGARRCSVCGCLSESEGFVVRDYSTTASSAELSA